MGLKRSYLSIVHNGGIIKRDQKHFTLMIEDINTPSKGFSSIEFHPDGKGG